VLIVKAIIMDLDGTLVNSEWLAKEAYNFGFKEVLGRPLTVEEKEELVGKPIALFLSRFPDKWDLIKSHILHYYQENIYKVKLYDGIENMLESLLMKDYKLGIVTSQLKHFANSELENNKIHSYFQSVLTVEDCVESKPHPLPLIQAAKELNIDPKQCMYIGDQITDIQAAHASQMKSGAALWGEGMFEKLVIQEPNFVFNTPSELLELLNQKLENKW
jgi:pyrophosphatase PpaX